MPNLELPFLSVLQYLAQFSWFSEHAFFCVQRKAPAFLVGFARIKCVTWNTSTHPLPYYTLFRPPSLSPPRAWRTLWTAPWLKFEPRPTGNWKFFIRPPHLQKNYQWPICQQRIHQCNQFAYDSHKILFHPIRLTNFRFAWQIVARNKCTEVYNTYTQAIRSCAINKPIFGHRIKNARWPK